MPKPCSSRITALWTRKFEDPSWLNVAGPLLDKVLESTVPSVSIQKCNRFGSGMNLTDNFEFVFDEPLTHAPKIVSFTTPLATGCEGARRLRKSLVMAMRMFALR